MCTVARLVGSFASLWIAAWATCAGAQPVSVTNAPRAFVVVAPSGWVRGPIVTGNTRLALVSPNGTPRAECAVTVVELQGVNALQRDLDELVRTLPSVEDARAHLANSYKNVKVTSVAYGLLAGFVAQVVRFEYSVGTPLGELWGVGVTTTTMISPNMSWVVGCGGAGRTPEEARRAANYWQIVFNDFPTTLKLK